MWMDNVVLLVVMISVQVEIKEWLFEKYYVLGKSRY
jgi:hypothetical protein